MKTLLSILFVACAVTSAHAQAKLQGRLVTEKGAPVTNVEVVPHNGVVTRTKRDGTFVIHFDSSVHAGDSTTVRVSGDWYICSPYRGRFVTVAESDTATQPVTVARRGSECVLTPANYVNIIREMSLVKGQRLDLSRDLKKSRTEVRQLTAELESERQLRQKLESQLALLTVLSGVSGESGVPLEALQKGIDKWAHTEDRNDSASEKATKQLYLGNLPEAEALAHKAGEDNEKQIDSKNREMQKVVRERIFNAYVEVAAQSEQGKSVEALKTLETLDRLFSTGRISRETFREEWGISRVILGVARTKVAFDKMKSAPQSPPDDVFALLSEAIANHEEALTVFKEDKDPLTNVVTKSMLGLTLFASTLVVHGEEKAQRLQRAASLLDVAFKLIREPPPASCDCPPDVWAKGRLMMGFLLGGVGVEIGGEQGGRLLVSAGALLDQSYSAATDTLSRKTWANIHAIVGVSLLTSDEPGSPADVASIKTAVEFLDRGLGRVSRDEIPEEWADLKNFRALASVRLGSLPGADGEGSFRAGLAAYEEAADFLAAKGLRKAWAQNQTFLGSALIYIGGQTGGDEGTVRLTRAVKIFEGLLKVYEEKENPAEWALAQVELGMGLTVLSQRLNGEEQRAKLTAAVAALEKALTVIKPETAPSWAQTQAALGRARLELGRNSQSDQEAQFNYALKAFEEALKVTPEKEAPKFWALYRGGMGLALLNLGRTVEQDSENRLNGAVKAFEDTLRIFNEEDSSKEWAQSQANLGLTYLALAKFIPHDQERNLLTAVKAFEQALRKQSEKDSPNSWAQTQGNMGLARLNLGLMLERDRESNFYAAAESFRGALRVFSEKDSPEDWMKSQGSLGLALLNLGQMFERDSESNLLAAAEAFENTLRVVREKDSPDVWAESQGHLGAALLILGRTSEHDREGRLLRALKAFRSILNVFNEKDSPLPWAQNQDFLGQTYLLMAQTVEDDWEGSFTKAVEAYRRVVTVFAAQGPPPALAQARLELARALTTQGRAYGPQGVQPLTEAVATYDQMLAVYQGQAFVNERAQTQLERGAALLSLGGVLEGAERNRRLTGAIAASEAALKTFTQDAFPGEWAEAKNNLADALLGLNRPKEAERVYAQVLSADAKNERAASSLDYIYHELFFDYAKAYKLQQSRAQAQTENVSEQANFAEKNFTTGRFGECERLIASLLRRPKLDASMEIALRMIEIANLLALGQPESVGARMDSLIKLADAQPPEFQERWIFEGTIHFISTNKQLAARRVWLLELFAAVKAGNRDSMVSELKRVRASYRE